MENKMKKTIKEYLSAVKVAIATTKLPVLTAIPETPVIDLDQKVGDAIDKAAKHLDITLNKYIVAAVKEEVYGYITDLLSAAPPEESFPAARHIFATFDYDEHAVKVLAELNIDGITIQGTETGRRYYSGKCVLEDVVRISMP